MDGTERIEPPSWYFAFAAAFFLIGVGGMIYSLTSGINHIRDNMVRMDVPGQMDLELKKATYTVFLEYDMAGLNSQPSQAVSCDVHVLPSNEKIEPNADHGNTTYTYNRRKGSSLFEFDAPHDATYTLACLTSGDTSSLKPSVEIGGGVTKGVRIMMMRSFVVMAVSSVIALLIFLRVSMLRMKSRKEIRERGLRPI